jgi:hypothetical protein
MRYPRRRAARDNCELCRVSRSASTIGKSFLLVGVFLALGAHAGSQSPRVAEKPWETKDWKGWTREECEDVLMRSPWGLTHPPMGGHGYYEHYTAQFRSALPVRHALIRLKQLRSGYDKMNPKKRKVFDQKVDTELGGSFEDHVVVRIFQTSVGNWSEKVGVLSREYLGNSAVLLLPNGRSVLATQYRRDGESAEAIFPRFVNGEPIIKPEDKVLIFRTGDLKKSVFTVKGTPYVFKVDAMVYNGKLEY